MAVLEIQHGDEIATRIGLADDKPLVIGRGTDADIPVRGDGFISRRHVEIRVIAGRLSIRRLPGTGNPVISGGQPRDEFSIAHSERFAIGQTQFVFHNEGAQGTESGSPTPAVRQTLEDADLYAASSQDELRLLDLLELPEILATRPEAEAWTSVAAMARMGTGAAWAGIVRADGTAVVQDTGDGGGPQDKLSRSLIRSALASAPRPTLHSWDDDSGGGTSWAICAGIAATGGEPVALYLTGREGSAAKRRSDSRYAGLVADIVGRNLSVKRLENRQERLKRFFSGPVISKILESADPSELQPKLAQSTVMFFDLRGFSLRTEEQDEKVLAHLGALRGIMTAMTEEIFAENGVVLSYVGDGILACWNVPIPDPDHVNRACRAALKMVQRLKQMPGHWRCGIGLHTGRVVAGAMGSDQVFSYGVMGKVVNAASRVEGIAKIVESQILATREISDAVSKDVAVPVRLGRFQPVGMAEALEVFEITNCPADESRVEAFAEGLTAFEAGHWEKAYAAFDTRAPDDRPARFLKSLAEAHRRRPPRDWRGVVELSEK